MLKEQQTSSSPSSFFLFPNPNPLLRSNYVSEPTIHLLGIDPYSYLNPNPHTDDKLKPMAPLDVDPCAASSRTQVITTNATHLTASEHAGGSFAEPAMASNSPAHSETTSAPQIVYHVEETKMERKNAENIRCDLCNVLLNSEEMFREHKEGKKHLKNLQKLSVSVSVSIQEMPPPVDFFENLPPVESLFTCNIPDLVRHDQVKVTEHPHSEKQEAQVTSGPLYTSLSGGTLFQSSNSGTEKVEDDLINLSQRLWCEVCKVTCNGKQNLLQHNLGKKHLKNLKNSAAAMATTPVADSEEVCNAIKKNFRKHVKGKKYSINLHETEKITGLPSIETDSVIIQPNDPVENSPKSTKGEVVNPNDGSCTHLRNKHKKAVRITKKLNGHGGAPVKGEKLQDMMIEEGKVVFLEMGKRKANGSLASGEEDADVKRKKVMKEGGGASISCNVCNVCCTSMVAFMDHLAGQEHSAMALKQVK